MPRQPNGRPAIMLRADGLWHCDVTIGTYANGRPKQKQIKRKTAGEVATAVDELLVKLKNGRDVEKKVETLADWTEHWLQNIILRRVRMKKLSHNTYVDYRKICRNHIVPTLGHWRLSGRKKRLEPEHVEEVYAQLAERGLAGSYVVRIHAVLSLALGVAYKRGIADRNVGELVDRPEFSAAKVDSLTLVEAQAVLKAALDDDMAARWILGIIQGPRQGEVLGLRWPMVVLDPEAPDVPHIVPASQLQRRQWEHGCDDPVACARPHCRTRPCPPRYLHGCVDETLCPKTLGHACPQRRRDPDRQCSRHLADQCPPLCAPGCTRHALRCPDKWGGGLVEGDPKTNRSAEPVALAGITVELLRAHRERQIQAAPEGEWDAEGYVFVDERGKPLDPRRDYGNWRDLLARAGVKRHRLHAARHTTGTFLRATGSDLKMIMDVLRHTKISTSGGYVDVALEAQRDAVDRVAAALIQGDLSKILYAQR